MNQDQQLRKVLEAVKPFEKLFMDADRMGRLDETNIDCQISVSDLRMLAYSVSDLRAALTATQQAAPSQGADDVCASCAGSGVVTRMTSHLGPDDYEFDAECEACHGTGSADIRDAIKALSYQPHTAKTCVQMVDRAEVLRIIDARAALLEASAQRERQWVGLTLDEVLDTARTSQDGISPRDDTERFARAIEAKLREKNAAQREQPSVAGYVNPIQWGDKESERVVKVTRHTQSHYGYTEPVAASKPELQVKLTHIHTADVDRAKRDALAEQFSRAVNGPQAQDESAGSKAQQQADVELLEPQAQAGEPEVVAWIGVAPRDGRINLVVDKPSPTPMRAFNFQPLIYLHLYREAMAAEQELGKAAYRFIQTQADQIAKKDAALKAQNEALEDCIGRFIAAFPDAETFPTIIAGRAAITQGQEALK